MGDLRARWTNNRFASTEHRGVNSSGRERYSVAAFVDPSFDCVIEPVVKPGDSRAYEPISAGDCLIWRFAKAFSYRNKQIGKA